VKIDQLLTSSKGEGLPLILEAALFAGEAHKGQWRKGAGQVPYINHPLEVAARLGAAEPCVDPEVIAAALLHDVIEDCGMSEGFLAEKFGAKVASIVEEVSEPPKAKFKYAERKAAVLARAPTFTREARLLKVSDMVTNLNDLLRSAPDEWGLEKQQGQFDRARRIFECIRGESARLDAEFEAVFQLRPEVDLRAVTRATAQLANDRAT
jgi:guanosine-3',5'-bis(diphosphate) 3'-pyrophosphohydrolase